ncbi:MAG: hypothetical protein MZV65_05235 [Chromatiales bacterium]|nr:hypothetical protein [Chromatiales bacterium]
MTTIDTLIHLGAGPCRELDTHLALQSERLILVEADPSLAEALSARVQGLESVDVRHLAVAAQPGEVTFHRYNLPDAGSLHPATGLKALFPGLKLLQTLAMEAVGIGDLIDSLQLAADATHRLIIDLPGEEFPCLRALYGGGQLHRFQWLSMYCGHEPLYEHGATAETILDWLSEQGFDLVERDETQDPDRPCWLLKRNPLKLECLALQARIQQLLVEQAALAKDKAALTAARDEQAKLAAERQQQIEALNAEKAALAKDKGALTAARDEQAKLAAERQQQIEALNAEKAALAKDKGALTAARDEQAKLAAERQQQIEALNAEKAALAKDKGALTAARDEQAKLAAERQRQIEALNAEKAALAKDKAPSRPRATSRPSSPPSVSSRSRR